MSSSYNFFSSPDAQFVSFSLWPSKIDWKSMDLSYLMEVTLMLLPLYAYTVSWSLLPLNIFHYWQDKFLNHFAKLVSDAKLVTGPDFVLKASNINGDIKIKYRDQQEFEIVARQFGIFEEWKVISVASFCFTCCIQEYHPLK